jgi:Icc-related predicted phosphoesterase
MGRGRYPFFFVSDLHGRDTAYRRLFTAIKQDAPQAVFLGGDLLPSAARYFGKRNGLASGFVEDFLGPELRSLKKALNNSFPRLFVIMGNDDARVEEPVFLRCDREGLWTYMHRRHTTYLEYQVFGYSCVPPTPFALKDWERYDVSHFVDPGALAPEAGRLTVAIADKEIREHTIQEDLEALSAGADLAKSIFLFHAPPYQTSLDRAALDGRFVEHVPLDVHVGSIAIQRFIREHQPLLTLHGHVHESTRLTGSWKEKIGRTYAFSAAHDGPELAIVCFDPVEPEKAIRRLF